MAALKIQIDDILRSSTYDEHAGLSGLHVDHIINAGCYSVILQSKNTKHYRHILHQQYPKFSSCKIQHKHHFANQFHDQGNALSLQQAIDEIKDHGYFHPHVRPLKKKYAQKIIQKMPLLSVNRRGKAIYHIPNKSAWEPVRFSFRNSENRTGTIEQLAQNVEAVEKQVQLMGGKNEPESYVLSLAYIKEA